MCVTTDNPGAQEGQRLYHPGLDYTGKLTGGPAATGCAGLGPLEGTHILVLLSLCGHSDKA